MQGLNVDMIEFRSGSTLLAQEAVKQPGNGELIVGDSGFYPAEPFYNLYIYIYIYVILSL